MNVTLSASAAIALTASTQAFAASSEALKTGPQDCWTDLSTGDTVCVPIGADLVSAVNEKYKLHLLEESSPGVTTDMVTGDL